MADISQVNLPNDANNPYNIADTTARNDLADKMDKVNPTGSGSFSLNRKAETTIGTNSFTEGYNGTASAYASHAEGYATTANGASSHAEGSGTTASGTRSHAEGYYTTANHRSQHVFGEYNALDDSVASSTARGNYVEIVGNGTANDSRSNARTLDWSGNEVLSGTIEATGFGTTLKQAVIDAIYPVGSIYMTVSDDTAAKVKARFGGTWEAWGSGRVPVGVDSNDTAFDTVEETGGHKSNSYTPAGTNSGCAVTAHTYTPAGTNSGCAVTAHTYTPAGTNSGCAVTAHTYTPAGTNSGCAVTAHTYTPAGTVGNTTLKVSQIPSHTHKTCVEGSGTWGLTGNKDLAAGSGRYGIMSAELTHAADAVTGATGGGGSHTHTFTGTKATLSHTVTQPTFSGTKATLSHTVTQPTFSGTKATLSHTVTQPTFSGTKATLSHTVTQPTFSGTAANISTVQPYITCYMWKRTG